MEHETVTGLVAKAVSSRDADRYLTILTAEQGKIECYAKGIRNQKSKLAATAGLLTLGEYKLFRSRDRYILTSGKPIELFYGIRADVARYACAAHMIEIALDVMPPAQQFTEALQTLLNSLHMLAHRGAPPEFVARVFEIRILALSGFAPMLDRCSACGRPLADGERRFFSMYGYGLICGGESCLAAAGKNAMPISGGAVKALAHVAECEPGDIFRFKLSDGVLRELSAAVPEYMKHHFGKAYERLDEAERYRSFEQEAAYIISRRGII
ncbi:MAG: DNA repair protein RecO [Clostridiales bacterium]|jgi:DNA repair protein RecO (recombination protein O)|nr:DNA repair protein RecO [Clostridiales bacterium]